MMSLYAMRGTSTYSAQVPVEGLRGLETSQSGGQEWGRSQQRWRPKVQIVMSFKIKGIRMLWW